MPRKITEEEFNLQVNAAKTRQKNPVEILTVFINFNGTHSKVECRCLTCSILFFSQYKSVVRNMTGCRKCGEKLVGEANKITRDEWESFILRDKNKNIKILLTFDEYKNNQTKISYICNVCGYIGMSNFSTLRTGSGCKACGYVKTGNAKRYTQKKYYNVCRKIFETTRVCVLTKFIDFGGIKTQVLGLCCDCGKTIQMKFDNLRMGERCYDCGRKQAALKRRWTEEEYNSEVQKIFEKSGIAVKTKFEELEFPISKNKIECVCSCGNVYYTGFQNVQKNEGCLVCAAIKRKITKKEFYDNCDKIKLTKKITVLDGWDLYECGTKKLNTQCDVCGAQTKHSMNSLLNKGNCQTCKLKAQLMSEEEFDLLKQQLLETHEIEILDDYKQYSGFRNKNNVHCLRCDRHWKTGLNNFKYVGSGCVCSAFLETKPEKTINAWLVELNLTIQKHRRDLFTNSSFEIDLFLPEKNIGVEYHGLYWHSSTKKKNYQTYHNYKYNLAVEEGITLIQIFEDEYTNNPELVHSIIRYKVGKPLRTIPAAEYMLASADTDAATQFVAANSFGTFNPAHKAFALCLQDTGEPVAMFTWHRIDTVIHFQYYVARDTVVVDGLVGLLNTLSMVCPDAAFETCSDARYTLHDAELVQCGFTLKHMTPPERYLLTNNYKTRTLENGDNEADLPEIYGVGHNVYVRG